MRFRLHPITLAVMFAAFILLIPAGYVAGKLIGVPAEFAWRGGMLVAATVVVLASIVLPRVWNFAHASSNVTTSFSHYDSEKRVSISHVEAMIAAGRYNDAADELDLLLRMHGLDRGVCLLAVELHLGKFGVATSAETLLRRMRAEQPTEWEGFATQRLIDLYMRDAQTHPKAMTELRRTIARFPGTKEAEGAALCLRQFKDRGAQTAA